MTTPAIPGLPVTRAASGPILLNRYQGQQSAVALRAAQAIYNLWLHLIHPESFNAGWAQLEPLANGIVNTHYNMTAASAAQYYSASRVVAGNTYMNVPGVSPDEAYISKVLSIMGPGMYKHYLKDQPPENAITMTADGLKGSVTRLVLAGGRDTVTGITPQDPVAKGWERVIEPGACSFCAMLAGRGAVYKESTADFRAHDHCKCVARAVFIGEPSVNTGLSEAWGEATKGTRGKAAIAAWDKYWSSHGNSLPGTAQEPTEARAGNAA
jgi:hypothetical protein